MTHWIHTFTGRQVTPTAMTPDMVCIEDVAHALSLTNRFTGHTKQAYSVAQHSVLVSLICKPEHALWGLLHDAAEAYMADVSRPVKKAVREVSPVLDLIESGIMVAVCRKFGLPLTMPDNVNRCDEDMLAHESHAFFSHHGHLYPKWQHYAPNWWECREDELCRQRNIIDSVNGLGTSSTPAEIERWFLKRFGELTNHRKET